MHSDHHTDWIGRRRTLFGFNIIFFIGAVCVSIRPPDVSVLILVQILTTIAGGSRGVGYIYGGRVISGIGIGGMSAVAPAYVSECSPKDVRGRITGIFQLMVATGVMTSYFINRSVCVLPITWRELMSYLNSCRQPSRAE